ncbi:MAG TPA: hypothetical protein VMX17_09620 [Candidatus Glassbacteria bacterium]|nr:hypothetical protein [Candidatus Glassbacteria bacterium]
MNNDFRILGENTISFKKDKLYVMLLRDSGEFGVEVTTKSEGLGRKLLESKEKAVELFDALSEKLLKEIDIAKAINSVKVYFKLKDINEVLFLLNSEDIVRSQNSIGDLYDLFKFKVKTKYDTKGDDYLLGSITIYIFFKNKTKPIGRFSGTRFGDDFIFERLI